MPKDGAIALAPGETIDEEALEKAVEAHLPEAREALESVRVGAEGVPNAAALEAMAPMSGMPLGKFWITMIKGSGKLASFAAALRSQGVALETWKLTFDKTQFNDKQLAAFLARATSFRCQVLVGGEVEGSGILVGPSSVLTAWHVIGMDSEGRRRQPPYPAVQVKFADGRLIDAGMPQRAGSSCADIELFGDEAGGGRQPRSDDEVSGFNDVALLSLKEPAGIHLGFAAVVAPAYEYPGPAAMLLIHYPEGKWRGVEFGNFKKLRKLTARWGYELQGSRGGSSGGGCFDTSFRLAGIHQGRGAEVSGRLVPAVRFYPDIEAAIAEDETPQTIWSLDGTPDGALVVGRDRFFVAYHAASRGPSRVRGIWIQRTDLTHDVSGLPFSFEMLSKLAARSPETRLVRISFETVVPDLPAEVARRVAESGLAVEAPPPAAGVGVDQTEPEAVVADRARALAMALDRKAKELGVRLWLYFDHPSVVFSDEPRWALTALIDQALRLDNLRICLAGFEAVQMPGDKFDLSSDAQSEGRPGLMVEYLTGFSDVDVGNLIRSAAADMGREISAERVKEWTLEALQGLNEVNGQYDSAIRAEIGTRLRPRLKQLLAEGGGG